MSTRDGTPTSWGARSARGTERSGSARPAEGARGGAGARKEQASQGAPGSPSAATPDTASSPDTGADVGSPGVATAEGGGGPLPAGEAERAEGPGAEGGTGDAAVPESGAGLEAVTRQRDEYLDALRRLQAEFENYKKRVIKQQTTHLERAAEALVDKLLPVLDTLDLAQAHAEGDGNGDGEALVQVRSMLNDVLSREGLERIDPLGEPFDPTAHDAVMHEEAHGETEAADPLVTEVFRAGYRWKGRVIRPAMVKVTG